MTVKIVTEDYLKKMENNIINAFINHKKLIIVNMLLKRKLLKFWDVQKLH